MSCIDQAEIDRLTTLLATHIAILDAMTASMLASAGNPNQRFRLDSGMATQSAWMIPVGDLQKNIDIQSRIINSLRARLNACGVVYSVTRRR